MIGGAESGRWRGKRVLCLIAMALLASGLVLLATRNGVPTSSDSAAYVGAARSIDAGHGLDVPIHFYPLGQVDIGTPAPGRFTPRPTPLVIYAPLEPLLLAIGGHPIGAARVEDAIFLALAVLVIGLIILSVTDVLWLALATELVVACSLAVVLSAVGTLAPALFFAVVALGAVIAYRDRPKATWLVVASVAIGLATLERYAAGGLIVWGVLALRHRRRAALAFLVMSSVPLGAWFAYEAISGRSTGHFLGFHVVLGTLHTGIRSVAGWVLPWSSSAASLLGAAVVAVVVFLVVRRNPPPAARLLLLFAVVQIVILEVAITFFDAGVNLDPYELVPVFVAVVMAVACAIDRPTAMKLLVTAVVAACVVRVGMDIATNVPGDFAEPHWVHSPIVAAVRTLPTRTVIYTNAPDVLYLLDGRATSSIPETVDFSTLKQNSRFDAQLAEIRETLSARRGRVVYVRGLGRTFLPSEASLIRLLPLRLLRDTSDGAIYALAPQAH